MPNLLLLALVGLAAQLVDGSLGMAYGATSSSLLLVAGIAPATVSASVHLAEVGTTLIAGASHSRFGNVDWKLALRLGLPGAIGALAGATVLSNLSTEAAAPVMATILLLIGAYIMVRFAVTRVAVKKAPLRTRFVTPLGLVAGFVDATGGGGWGPVATPSLLVTNRVEPRKVIGTVDASEFLVTVAASVGFFVALGSEGFDAGIVLALLAGGAIAAPTAAWLVRKIPERFLGASVGGLLVLTNARSLLRAAEAPGGLRAAIYLVIVVLWVAGLVAAARLPGRSSAPRDDELVVAGAD